MRRYHVEVMESYWVTYEVVAGFPEEAEVKVLNGHGNEVDKEFRERSDDDVRVNFIESLATKYVLAVQFSGGLERSSDRFNLISFDSEGEASAAACALKEASDNLMLEDMEVFRMWDAEDFGKIFNHGQESGFRHFIIEHFEVKSSDDIVPAMVSAGWVL